MSATPDSTLVDSSRTIADLRRELAECEAERDAALAREAATAEVLQVINSSPGDLTPVFDAILEKALRLCGAVHGDLWTYDGERFQCSASQGEERFSEWLRQQGGIRPWPGSPGERMLHGEVYVHYHDALEESSFEAVPEFREQVRIADVRTLLCIPLRKEKICLG